MTPQTKRLVEMMDQAYLEVIPSRTIIDRLVHIPRQSYVAITCSPSAGIDATLDIVDELRDLPEDRRLKLAPHIAARMVRDKAHLKDIVQRLDAARVESIFVPGGDATQAAGKYEDALSLLRDLADIGHQFEDVGVAAHPEGHPIVSKDELLRLLLEKQPFATYLVTQMCFDPNALIEWLRGIREAGVTLPAWLGLPGVAELHKLITLSMRIGVGQSLRVLKKQKGLVKKVFSARPYRPDDLLEGLRPHLDNPVLNIPGFHLFCFNNVEATETWRKQTWQRLRETGT